MKVSRKGFTVVLASLLAGLAVGGAAKAAKGNAKVVYRVANLPSLGGTNSRGNSIDNRGWVSGYSNLAGNQKRHATLWVNGVAADLQTLGGPNSSVAWPVKNNAGRLAGISQTSTPDPLGENWSCAAFFPAATATGYTCLGFVWESGVMTALPTLGGNNGFATGSNNRGQTVGWAETAVHDSTCVAPQVLQFRAAVWGPGADQVQELPLVAGDTSSAATAINDRGQVVGISGRCDQAVGRFTAIHAVLWDKDGITDLGNLGALLLEHAHGHQRARRHRRVRSRGRHRPGQSPTPRLREVQGERHPGPRHAVGRPVQRGAGNQREPPGRGNLLRQRGWIGVCRAFLWQDGVMTDLNTLVAPGYTNLLTSAQDINDAGVITGRALTSGGQRPAFVATPHP